VTIPAEAASVVHPLDEVFVLHARPLRTGARLHETARFTDAVWRLEPAIGQQHQRAAMLDFTRLPVQHRLVAKELCYAMLSGPLLHGEQRAEISTVRTMFIEVKRFMDWLVARRHPAAVSQLRGSDLDDYVRWIATIDLHPRSHTRALSGVRLFWRYRNHLHTDRLSFDPLPLPGWSRPMATTPDNATARIPEPVYGALLTWALRFIDDFAPDILHADTHWRLKCAGRPGAPTGQGTEQDVRRLLGQYLANGHALPGRRGQPNVRLLAIQAGTNHLVMQRCRPEVTAAAARVGVAAAGMFPGPITGRLDGQPWIDGIATIHRGSDQTLACLARMLQASCYAAIAYLSGMRDSEVKHLRRGCLRVHRDPDGHPYRYSVNSLAFKGEKDHTGTPATWIVGAPAARAISILEQLQPPDADLLFAPLPHGPGNAPVTHATNAALVSSSTNLQLNALTAWINDYCAARGRPDGIPLHNGQPWRLKTSQFRRTLAWHIARRPGGAIAGAIQYRHLSIQMFEGYAGTADSGFRAEVESEQALARGEHLLAMTDAHEHHGLTGPAAPEAARRLQEFDEHARFQGVVITDPRQLRRLMTRADPAVYPGSYVTCVFDHTKALCRHTASGNHSNRPDLGTCRPLDCRNVALTPDNFLAWQAELDHIDARLNTAPPLPPLLRRQLDARRDYLTQFLNNQRQPPR
jgi:hypothetical protein